MKELRADGTIIIAVLFLLVMGVAMVYSASAVKAEHSTGDWGYFAKRQGLFALAGVGVMVLAALVPYRLWRPAVFPLLLVTLGLLVAVMTPLGHRVNGSSRWLRLGPFSLQAAELAKFTTVVYLARYLERKGEALSCDPRQSWRPLALVVVTMLLVLKEPDLGTAVFIGVLAMAMLFLGGVPVTSLAGVGLLALPAVGYMVLTESYRWQRMLAFRNPWEEYSRAGFQLVQSFLAFGEGGVLGTGLGGGKSKLFFLPESHTDFVLAVVGEELGLLGVGLVLFLFGLLAVRGMRAAAEAPDSFGSLLAGGMTALICLQALINAMVVLGLLPTKGLPLPFLSYGGSSLLVTMAATGVLLNVGAAGRREA